MVLSNKKLKQKLRSLVAESLVATDAGGGGGDVKDQLQTVKQILISKSQKPKSVKRPKIRKNPPLAEKPEAVEETKKESNGQEKSKKRKRDGDGGQEQPSGEGKKKEGKKKEKKVKKKKKQKKKKEKEKEKEKKKAPKGEKKEIQIEKGSVSANEETGDKGAAESVQSEESEHDPKKIYVGGIPYYSTEDDIMSFFQGCGTVTEIDCMFFPETGKFRGIAMLTFKTEAAAKRALALDGADMGGFYLKIQPYKVNRAQKSDFTPEIVDGYNRIYIGNLSWDVTEDDLKKFFCECKVSSIRFGTDKETDEFKGYAHIDFADSESLAVALKLDQKEVCGRPVKIRCAVPKKGAETKSTKKGGDSTIAGKSKKKRLPCYLCGVWGHLAAVCTRKTTVEVDGSNAVKTNLSLKLAAKNTEDHITNGATKERRTCYECRLPGHLASDCPKRRTIEVASSKAVETGSSLKPAARTKDTGDGAPKKRRTCYQCGVPGHLASDCPRKNTIDENSSEVVKTNSSLKPAAKKTENTPSFIPDAKKIENTPSFMPSAKKSETSPSLMPAAKKTENGTSQGPKKKKRQTCYACGVPGHLASECPSKQTVEVDVSGGNS